MRDYAEEATNKVRLVLLLLILAAVIFTFLGISQYINILSQWTIAIVAGFVTTAVAQVLIQSVSGDFLEEIPLKIWGFRISLFTIATIIIKLVIFH
jgi:hypothetical protein